MANLERALASIAQQERAVSVGLGPHGLDQLLVNEANQPIITNSGDVILSSACPEDAIGALILKLVEGSCAALGDASKRVLIMVLAGIRQYLRSGLYPHTLQYDLAQQVLQCIVPSAVMHVPLPPGGLQPGDAATEALHALICTHLCGSAGGQAAEQHLADCLQELVQLQLSAAAAAGLSAAEALSSLRDSPPMARLPGAPPTQSRLLRGVLLHEMPLAGPGPGPAGPLLSPTFLALSCPLDGEPITSVVSTTTAAAGPSAGGAGGGGPSVAIRVASEAERGAAEAAVVELLRRRIALLAERGVDLLLLCGRPPPVAAQLCRQYSICMIAGLDEQDVARASAAGGGAAPLTRAGLAALSTAPLGRAAAARLVGLGARRRAVLLEFSKQQWRAAGQAACTLLLCGVSEAAVRQAARAVQRCLISIATAVGTLNQTEGGAGGSDEGSTSGGECLVFVAGGGGFETLLEHQLRNLIDVAKRGPSALAVESDDEGEMVAEDEEARRTMEPNGMAGLQTPEPAEAEAEAAAAEARAASELLASLRVLHAMAAAVPRALVGADAGVGQSGGGGRTSGSQRRMQREALLHVQSLRAAQATALQRGEVLRCGMVVPSAAFSFHGKALRRQADDHGAAAPQGAGDGTGNASEGCGGAASVRIRPAVGGHGFVAAPDAVSYGVVEPAAVAASAWTHAVDVLRQVLRIDGPAAAAAAAAARQRRCGGGGPTLAVAGPVPVEVPRSRRGGYRESWDSELDDVDYRTDVSSDDG